MDPLRNPYVPGAGRRPAVLVGRDDLLNSWKITMRRAERGVADPPLIMYGLRGVGKTVLLSQMRRDSEKAGWLAVQCEAGTGSDLRSMIAQGLYGPLMDLNKPSAGKRLLRALKTALSFRASYDSMGTWSFGVDLSDASGGGADSGVLEYDLRKLVKDVSAAAAEEDAGLAILIDEAQDLEQTDLAALSSLAQAAAQDGWPFILALAGLPSLPSRIAEAKSYAERFRYVEVKSLDSENAREALQAPAEEENVTWTPQALSLVAEAAGNYPYFLQQFGQSTWEAAESSPINVQAAQRGIELGWTHLEDGFFRARWERATPAEKEYLRAMGTEGDVGIPVGLIAQRMCRSVRSIAPIRAKLVAKTLIYAPEHGVVAFTVPGMATFISRQITD